MASDVPKPHDDSVTAEHTSSSWQHSQNCPRRTGLQRCTKRRRTQAVWDNLGNCRARRGHQGLTQPPSCGRHSGSEPAEGISLFLVLSLSSVSACQMKTAFSRKRPRSSLPCPSSSQESRTGRTTSCRFSCTCWCGAASPNCSWTWSI